MGLEQTRLYSHRRPKALISFAVTAKLICAFVFGQAKLRFSHDVAQYIYDIFICFSVERTPFTKGKIIKSVAESESVSRILFEEVEQKLLAKDEMIKVALLSVCIFIPLMCLLLLF